MQCLFREICLYTDSLYLQIYLKCLRHMCTCKTVPPSFLTANETPTPRIPNTMTENKNIWLCIMGCYFFRFQVRPWHMKIDLRYLTTPRLKFLRHYVTRVRFKCFVKLFLSISCVDYPRSSVVKVVGLWRADHEFESVWGWETTIISKCSETP